MICDASSIMVVGAGSPHTSNYVIGPVSVAEFYNCGEEIAVDEQKIKLLSYFPYPCHICKL